MSVTSQSRNFRRIYKRTQAYLVAIKVMERGVLFLISKHWAKLATRKPAKHLIRSIHRFLISRWVYSMLTRQVNWGLGKLKRSKRSSLISLARSLNKTLKDLKRHLKRLEMILTLSWLSNEDTTLQFSWYRKM